MREIIVDNFAGGGGASTGIEIALGISPDVAINHDAEAVAMHEANHQATLHLHQKITAVNPHDVMPGRAIGLAWFSPDCKHFSKAKGAAPVEKNIRDLAWVVVAWAEQRRPRVIILENVEEFTTWGPLMEVPLVAMRDEWGQPLRGADGEILMTPKWVPDPARKGETFQEWVGRLRRAEYRVEWRELRACDYGAPTIRKRLFLVARCDGQPIVWPEPTHGPGLLPYRTAAECIDWSLPCPSIFERERPLAEATLRRIARGIQRFVIEAAEPFIIPITHGGPKNVHNVRCNSVQEPLRTLTTQAEHALVAPYVMPNNTNNVPHGLDEPVPTITTGNRNFLVAPILAPFLVPLFGDYPGGAPRVRSVEDPVSTLTTYSNTNRLVAPYLIPRYGERDGQEPRTREVDAPLPTVVPTQNGAQLCAAFLAQHNGGMVGHRLEKPVSTLTTKGSNQQLVAAHLEITRNNTSGQAATEPARAAEVRAFLTKYYKTAIGQALTDPFHTGTTRDRFGLVTVAGQQYEIVDIGMRMLSPRELFRAQGFPETYAIDVPGPDGKPLTKTAQIRMCGNSVCPPMAAAMVRANVQIRDSAHVIPLPPARRRRPEAEGQEVLFA